MRLIDADALKEWLDEYLSVFKKYDKSTIKGFVDHAPTIEVVPKDFHDKTCEAMAKRHTEEIQRVMPKRGEWEEKETFHNGDDEPIIEEWQSAMCSVCHKYHTTPYMYYFNNYNFCPNCGADMRGNSDDV